MTYITLKWLLQEYVFRVDPVTSLGLNSDSIMCYRMKDVVRGQASEVPELLPCGYLVGDNNVITVNLKGEARRAELLYSSQEFLNLSQSQSDRGTDLMLLTIPCVDRDRTDTILAVSSWTSFGAEVFG